MRMPLPERSAAGRASRLRAIGKPGAESLSVSQIQLLLNLLFPLPGIERLAAAGLVGQLAMIQAGRAGIGMFLAVLFVLDVQHLTPAVISTSEMIERWQRHQSTSAHIIAVRCRAASSCRRARPRANSALATWSA